MAKRNRPTKRQIADPEAVHKLHAAADIQPSERVLDLGWNGACTPGPSPQSASVLYYTSDIRLARSCGIERPEVEVLLAETLPAQDEAKVDVVLYHPAAHAGKVRIYELIDQAFRMMKVGGRLLLSGNRDRGIESLARRAEAVFENGDCPARKGRRRVYRFEKRSPAPGEDPVDPEGSFEVDDLPDGPLMFNTLAGTFSWDGFDPGSRILLESVDVRTTDRILDIGCGCGVLGIVGARRALQGSARMVDVDLRAVACSRRNIQQNGIENAVAVAGDLLDATDGEPPEFDLVLSNPPFHDGRGTGDPLIERAANVLAPDGRLAMVVMRPAAYLKQLRKRFHTADEAVRLSGYTILAADRPKRP
jgi:16S rRNA (guanine1207-N2)-methyltransferase